VRGTSTRICRQLIVYLKPLCKIHDQIIGAEIGVAAGATAMGLLYHLPKLTLLMVDSWATYSPDHPYFKSGDSMACLSREKMDGVMNQAIANTDFAKNRRRIIRNDSAEAASEISDSSLHFAFIDADHTYDAVKRDIAAWWPKIMPGGFLSGHDYGFRHDRRGIWGVTRAVNEFVQVSQLELVRGIYYVWMTPKPAVDESQRHSLYGSI